MRIISRRQVLIAAGALLAVPGAALAQQAQKVRRIGILSLSVAASETAQWAKLSFASRMRAAGYEDGQNLAIEWRFAEGDASRLPALAEELVRLNVEVIMASFNDAIAAAKRATTTIPIVMFNSILSRLVFAFSDMPLPPCAIRSVCVWKLSTRPNDFAFAATASLSSGAINKLIVAETRPA